MTSHLKSGRVGVIFSILLVFLEALKLFIIDRDCGDDLQVTYRLFGGYPFHQEVLEKVSFEPIVLY